MLLQIQNRTYLYGFIPISTEVVGPESYLCQACGSEWRSDWPYPFDFGAHADSPSWKCFKCGKEVAYDKF
jgi:hypothetical protein